MDREIEQFLNFEQVRDDVSDEHLVKNLINVQLKLVNFIELGLKKEVQIAKRVRRNAFDKPKGKTRNEENLEKEVA